MISFVLSLVALVLGYLFYGRLVERVFGPDDRVTPAVAKADGLDYIVLPSWKIFMIQFLNIAGTGPIFGAIMGAKFGPVAYLWIVFGCIFAGAVHDYLSGMLSMRHDGAGLPELIGKYLGKTTKSIMLVFTVLLLIMVGTVFVYSPAEILHSIAGDTIMWVAIIFCYCHQWSHDRFHLQALFGHFFLKILRIIYPDFCKIIVFIDAKQDDAAIILI